METKEINTLEEEVEEKALPLLMVDGATDLIATLKDGKPAIVFGTSDERYEDGAEVFIGRSKDGRRRRRHPTSGDDRRQARLLRSKRPSQCRHGSRVAFGGAG